MELSRADQVVVVLSGMIMVGGLRVSLSKGLNLNIFSLIIELDAKAVVHAIQNSHYANDIIFPILNDCRQLISRFSRFITP